MTGNTTDTPVVRRMRALVEPIASDLQLDLYDVEQRGGTMRVTLDTPPGSSASVDLDQLALATRLISRELDHEDPIPGKYTLEVTSPGVERTLRTPAHYQREIGKTVSVRLANVESDERRFEGVLIAADDTTATIRIVSGDEITDRVVELSAIDRARTVFEWGPQPKPGGKGAPKQRATKQAGTATTKKTPKKTTENTTENTGKSSTKTTTSTTKQAAGGSSGPSARAPKQQKKEPS